MSVISTINYVSRVVTSRKTRQRTTPTPFSVGQAGESGRSSAAGAVSGTSLLGLQEEDGDDPQGNDRTAFNWGDDTLKTLRSVQVALLEGDSVTEALATLEGLCESAPLAASPGLISAIRSIRVRAAIEVAKARRSEGRSMQPESDRNEDGQFPNSKGR
ncbi:flagellar assembly protein FliX [Acetobacter fallax]|uniref:Uncharacterized protein n=1 Tax=Acetobacter fallax TaxID=1737473 RepID=A0ABX0K5L6_9PROT|nr:flagellar assembly protein FliX [Acetobacter fallax]NHO31047.1 hypothetical protein [Acetobacter fallax]NHO34604.1 hypothetical protein [Acetobacter fallax]